MSREPFLTRLHRYFEQHHPSAFLLAGQLLLLILYAVFDGNGAGRALISAIGVMVLMLAVWAVIHSPAANRLSWTLAIPAFALSVLSAIFPTNSTLLAWSSLVGGVFYFYAAGAMISYMMEDTRVTTDELFAAGATFTLFAWGYAHLYLVIQTWLPGSFLTSTPGQPATFLELLFLSFTNLSATGLGDIMPVVPIARVLAMLEQFTGVGYVAVVVSRLVSMTMLRIKSSAD